MAPTLLDTTGGGGGGAHDPIASSVEVGQNHQDASSEKCEYFHRKTIGFCKTYCISLGKPAILSSLTLGGVRAARIYIYIFKYIYIYISHIGII